VAAQEVLDSVLHVQLRRCDEHSSFLNLAIMKSVSRSGNFSMTQNAESRAHTHTKRNACALMCIDLHS